MCFEDCRLKDWSVYTIGHMCDCVYTHGLACLNLLGDSYCDDHAAQGDCETNPDWMVTRCRRACHACTELGTHLNSLTLQSTANALRLPCLKTAKRG